MEYIFISFFIICSLCLCFEGDVLKEENVFKKVEIKKADILIGAFEAKTGNFISPFKDGIVKEFRTEQKYIVKKENKIICGMCGEVAEIIIYYNGNWSCEDCLEIYLEE